MNFKFFIFVMAVLLSFVMLSSNVMYAQAYHNDDEQASRGSRDPKISSFGDDAYVVWEESIDSEFFDVYFRKIMGNGNSFGDTINLTQGTTFYPDPQILAYENNVYVLWEDRKDSPDGKDSVYFKKSNDNGKTFDATVILDPPNNTDGSIYSPITMIESSDVLYVFMFHWNPQTNEKVIIFRSSADGGNTFGETVSFFQFDEWARLLDVVSANGIIYAVSNDEHNSDESGNISFRKIYSDGQISDVINLNNAGSFVNFQHFSVSDNNVYAIWMEIINGRQSLSFTKSHDGGNTFDKPKKLDNDWESIGVRWSGAHVFSYDDFVYVIWGEEYFDGENQNYKTWFAKSDDRGDTFDVATSHPLDEKRVKYGHVNVYEKNKTLYFIVPSIKNLPYDDAALYFAKSSNDDGIGTMTDAVDLLEKPLPGFGLPQTAIEQNTIHIVSDGEHGKNCILYIASDDGGELFADPINLSPNGNPKDCLGIKENIVSPHHQIESGIEIEDVKCREDLSMGYMLVLREDGGQPVCVTATSYERMLEKNIISEKSFETIALNAAKNYLLSHPKISTHMIKDSLELETYMTRHSIPPAFIIQGFFDTSSPIYDDDDGKENAGPFNYDVKITLVQNNKVHLATIDDIFLLNELNESKQNQNPRDATIVSPTISTILSPGERINNKGMIPLEITEVSQGGYSQTTHWTFQSIGYHGDNKGKKWGFLPDQYRIHETVDQDGNDAVDRNRMSENFAVPQPLFIFSLLCNGEEKIEGESGWHYTLPTRTDTSMIHFRSTDKGIYPDKDGIYDIKFVSLFRPEVKLPPNTQVVSNQTILCPMEDTRNDATHAYYTRLEFKVDDEWTASYYSQEFSTQSDGTDEHATILVKIFGDKFDFTRSEFQLQNPQINFEPAEPDLIHKMSKDATLGFLFETLGMQLSSECFVFADGREFCNTDDYSLKFFVNDKIKDNISQYVISEDDKILVSYGAESEQDISEQLTELESVARYNYVSLETLMKLDVGTVRAGTYDGELGFQTVVKLMELDAKRQDKGHALNETLNQKQNQYSALVKQGKDSAIKESLLDEIIQIQSQLKDMSDKNSVDDGGNIQYTTEDIFQRTGEIESENIKMYQMGPEKYVKYVDTKNNFESIIEETYWKDKSPEEKKESFPLVAVQINSDRKSLEIVLHKDVESNSTKLNQYRSIIEEILPETISWMLSFSDDSNPDE